jgi:hypothetical protein
MLDICRLSYTDNVPFDERDRHDTNFLWLYLLCIHHICTWHLIEYIGTVKRHKSRCDVAVTKDSTCTDERAKHQLRVTFRCFGSLTNEIQASLFARCARTDLTTKVICVITLGLLVVATCRSKLSIGRLQGVAVLGAIGSPNFLHFVGLGRGRHSGLP